MLQVVAGADAWHSRFWEEGEENTELVGLDQFVKSLASGIVRSAKILILEMNLVTAIKNVSAPTLGERMKKAMQTNLTYLVDNPFKIYEDDIHPTILKSVRACV